MIYILIGAAIYGYWWLLVRAFDNPNRLYSPVENVICGALAVAIFTGLFYAAGMGVAFLASLP